MSWKSALYFGVAITLVVVGAGALIGQYAGAWLAESLGGML